jgi:hypothetical protein
VRVSDDAQVQKINTAPEVHKVPSPLSAQHHQQEKSACAAPEVHKNKII